MSGIEDAISRIQAKLDGLSGLPPDCSEEFDEIREEFAKKKPAPKPAAAKPAATKKK